MTPPLPVFNEDVARRHIPALLIHPHQRRWFIYRISWTVDERGLPKLKKFPYCIRYRKYGTNYDWNDKEGWTNFDDICNYIRDMESIYKEEPTIRERFRFWPGLPVLREFDMAFIDLDDCFLPDKSLKPAAKKYYDAIHAQSFVERSVSGKGLHLFCWYTGHREFRNVQEEGVEVYIDGRGALITGNPYYG